MGSRTLEAVFLSLCRVYHSLPQQPCGSAETPNFHNKHILHVCLVLNVQLSLKNLFSYECISN